MTLAEYLISLRYDGDQAGQKKFVDGLTMSKLKAFELGAAVVATAGVIEKSVEKTVKAQSDLFYAAAQGNTTVQSIQAAGYAASQTGSSFEQSAAAIQKFAAAVRNNPGLKTFFEDITGGAMTGDSTKDLQSLMMALSKKVTSGETSHPLAAAAAEAFDQSETDLQNWEQFGPEKIKQMELFAEKQRQMGVDAKEWADKSAEVQRNINSLTASLVILGQRIGMDWVGQFDTAVKAIDGFIQKVGEADAKSKGLFGQIGTIVGGGLGAWVTKKIIGGTLGMFGLGGAGAGAGGGGAAAAAGGGLMNTALRFLGPVGALIGSTKEANTGEAAYMKLHPEMFAGGGSKSTGDEGFDKFNPGNIRQGDGQIADFGSRAAGLRALMEKIEGGQNVRTLEQITGSIGPGGDANRDLLNSVKDLLADHYGKKLNGNEDINVQDPGLKAALADAFITALHGYDPVKDDLENAARGKYDLPGNPLGADGNMTKQQQNLIDHKTEIHITTKDDPSAIAEAVTDANDQSHADLIRLTNKGHN